MSRKPRPRRSGNGQRPGSRSAAGSGRSWLAALAENPRVFHIVDPEAGTCTGPDFRYRCKALGIWCKHLIAAAHRVPESPPDDGGIPDPELEGHD